MEEDADRNRLKAFEVQEWTTHHFGEPQAEGNEYRLSHRGMHYYLECLSKMPGAKGCHAYTGLMIHDKDLMTVTRVLVLAARAVGAR